MSKLHVKYTRHHFDDAQGHIYIDKSGPCTIALTGACSTTQEELDFCGEIMANALANMTPAQQAKLKSFGVRQ